MLRFVCENAIVLTIAALMSTIILTLGFVLLSLAGRNSY